MKKILVLSMLCSMTMACNQNKTAEDNKEAFVSPVYTRQDTAALEQAKVYFKIIPSVANNPQNQVTDDKVKLGKILYYDSRLSKTGHNSCNSCHNLASYGVDNLPTSIGDAGKSGDRNSPTVFNAALHNMQFWDGRAATVEEQAGMPILNADEMAIPHKGFLIDRLKKDTMYKRTFSAAFTNEKDPVNYANIQKAIGAFERTLLTSSRFDRFMNGDLSALNTDEKEGLQLFIDLGCITCHNGLGVGGNSLQKFGLVTDYRTLVHSRLNDEGKKTLTGNPGDKDVFKVPGLRNSEKTYPYFHNGGVASLDSAVVIMSKAQLNKDLHPEEVSKIVSFLKSLTGDIREDAKTFPPELKSLVNK
jgi:cytochrome c peroxidase